MILKISLLLATVYVAQSIEDQSNFDFFLTLDELEDPLRIENEKFLECYLGVQSKHEKFLNDFLSAMLKATNEISSILSENTEAMNQGNFGVRLLKNFGEKMKTYPKEIINFVKKEDYEDAADLVYQRRKEAELENSKCETRMNIIRRRHPDLAKKAEDIIDKIRIQAIKDGRSVAIEFTKCVEKVRCSPNAGYEIMH